MGVDLRLLPITCLGDDGWGYSHTVLDLPRCSAAWDPISKLPSTPIGDAKISSFVASENLKTDAYGAPYKYVKAADLAVVLRKYFKGNPVTAYVTAMPSDDLVILDWH